MAFCPRKKPFGGKEGYLDSKVHAKKRDPVSCALRGSRFFGDQDFFLRKGRGGERVARGRVRRAVTLGREVAVRDEWWGVEGEKGFR